MKKSKYIGMAMIAAGMFAATSCTDFDDYNKVSADATPSANQTLWENIQQNPQLSDFAALVKKSGFDSELSATQYYTVWAPLNGTFAPTPYQNMDDNALIRQFVKNHIASYGHHATGKLEDRILMLNNKSYDFEGTSGNYTFDGIQVDNTNLASNNGVMHTLNGVASFYPNLYEYVTDSVLAEGMELDSLRNFFLHYETTYLDTEHSVLGSIVNGMQTYVDSVMITENSLWKTLNVKMNEEDSSYTFLLPTNEAWAKTYNKIKSNFNYIATTNAQTFVNGSAAATPLSVSIDPTYWQDSLANRYLTSNLAYSNNNGYNKWLVGEATYLGTDTLYSTTRNKLSNPQDIIAQTKGEPIKMSNGVARVVDSLAMFSWETYAPERRISAYSNDNIARVNSGNASSVEVSRIDETKIDVTELNSSTFRYLWVEPSGGYSKPELNLYLPNVQSTTYDFYCVFVPENIDLNKANAETQPNRVIFTLNYCDATGALKEYVFLDESEENISSFQSQFNLTDNATNRTTIRAFSNDTSKVDTLYLGEFTFPVCYAGLGDGYCPNIKITSPFSAVTGTVRNAYTRDLRIAAIILKPKELVEFEESNKQ